MKHLFIAAAFAALAVWPAAAAETQPHQIAVMGEAELVMPPDYASVEVGVITQGTVVADALAENSAKMTRVIAALHDLGITDADIQTSLFTIEPRYEEQRPGAYQPESLRPIVGYFVANHVSVRVVDLTKVAKVIDVSVNAGANASGRVDFQVRNLSAQLDRARVAAVGNARHKAEVLTAAAHVQLSRAISITDNRANVNYDSDVQGNYGGQAEVVVVTGSRLPTPIAPGRAHLTVQVTVVYAVE